MIPQTHGHRTTSSASPSPSTAAAASWWPARAGPAPRRRLLGRAGRSSMLLCPGRAGRARTWWRSRVYLGTASVIAVLAHLRRYALEQPGAADPRAARARAAAHRRAARPAGAAQPRGPAHRPGQPPALGRRAARASAPRPASATPSSASSCSTSTTSSTINDRHGHPGGDEALRQVAGAAVPPRPRRRPGGAAGRRRARRPAARLRPRPRGRAGRAAPLRGRRAGARRASSAGEISLSLGRRRGRRRPGVPAGADVPGRRAALPRQDHPERRRRSAPGCCRDPPCRAQPGLPGIPCFDSQSRAAWATSAQPESTVSECPRSGNSRNSVTAADFPYSLKAARLTLSGIVRSSPRRDDQQRRPVGLAGVDGGGRARLRGRVGQGGLEQRPAGAGDRPLLVQPVGLLAPGARCRSAARNWSGVRLTARLRLAGLRSTGKRRAQLRRRQADDAADRRRVDRHPGAAEAAVEQGLDDQAAEGVADQDRRLRQAPRRSRRGAR